MNRIIFVFLTLFLSGSVFAAWTQIGDETAKTVGIDTGRGVKTFVMKDGIDKDGRWVVMWTLRDYESPVKVNGKEQFSSKSLVQYDCKDMEHKTLSFYWYSKHQAKGAVVYAEQYHGDLQPIIPGSLTHVAWKIACGK